MSHSIRTIEDLEHQRFGAMISGDAETLEALLSESLTYTHSHGGTDTKTVFLNNVRNGPVRYHSAERLATEIRLVGDTGVVTGRAKLAVSFNDQPIDLDLRYTAVWIHGEAGWQFEAWQSTSIA
ncbi:MAG: nuclear transport factor 2 family protein [Acidimicrobiaceae bacterium]|jgi:hypothetical protein|nr:nuclear transport factor 2 family protein [Acidimicrobiaceae bacterium]MBT5578885.1 nuclear transport factor 2 family protein [Acidimicrobiaceae bacterium]MBT5848989.1 nuclear transport factor 2 family protein [Acidimicrobiaceae bacterium]